MDATPEPVTRLVAEFSRLPGIGPKTASRLTYHLLRAPVEQVRSLGEAISQLRERIRFCSRCFNITETDPCAICSDERRDQHAVCVVEEPLDVLALEYGDYAIWQRQALTRSTLEHQLAYWKRQLAMRRSLAQSSMSWRGAFSCSSASPSTRIVRSSSCPRMSQATVAS